MSVPQRAALFKLSGSQITTEVVADIRRMLNAALDKCL